MVLLSLRRRRKQGPTLVSRLGGAAEDCLRLLPMVLEALLDNRRMSPPLVGADVGSVKTCALLLRLWPRDAELVFLEIMEGGSWKEEAKCSSSLVGNCSGEACSDELVVKVTISGVIMGESCRKLEAMEEPLMMERELEARSMADWFCIRDDMLVSVVYIGRGSCMVI